MTNEQEKLLLMLCDMHCNTTECRQVFMGMRQCEYTGRMQYEDVRGINELCPPVFQYYRQVVGLTIGEIVQKCKESPIKFDSFIADIESMREWIKLDHKRCQTRLFPLTIPAA